jgi:hypothetical protein
MKPRIQETLHNKIIDFHTQRIDKTIDQKLKKGKILPIDSWQVELQTKLRRSTLSREQLSTIYSLIHSFDDGRMYIFNTFSQMGWKFPLPAIRFMNQTDTVMMQSGKQVFVNIDQLLQKEPGSENIWLHIPFRRFQDLAFIGTSNQNYLLGGIEETFHVAFLFLNPKASVISADLYAKSGAEYDAEETEFQSLLWRLLFSIQQQLPKATISVLRSRAIKAYNFRRNNLDGQWRKLTENEIKMQSYVFNQLKQMGYLETIGL